MNKITLNGVDYVRAPIKFEEGRWHIHYINGETVQVDSLYDCASCLDNSENKIIAINYVAKFFKEER